MFRYAIVIFILAFCTQAAIAQEASPPTVSRSDPSPKAPKVQIVLEMRQPIVSDKFLRLLREHSKLKELPKIGEGDVFDQQQTAVLLSAAAGEHRNRQGPSELPVELTLKLANGEKQAWSLVGPRDRIDGDDSIEASLSEDGQTVQIEVSWAAWKENGKEIMPTTTVAVPLGSHLIIHTGVLAASKSESSLAFLPSLPSTLQQPLSELDQFADKLLGTPNSKTAFRRKYMVITPSIAKPEEQVRSARR